MPLTQSQTDEVVATVSREGNPRLRLAPIRELGPECPASWRSALSESNPTASLFTDIWSPIASKVPLTIAAWKVSLQGVGLLTTQQCPPSLIYFYKSAGEVFAYRGSAPSPLTRPEVSMLPAEFLEFYKVHNGFVDIFSSAMGPLPDREWFYLSDNSNEPAGSFLAIFNNGAGTRLGFDLSEHPPLSYVVWPDEPPKILPDVWAAIDEWMAAGLGNAERV